MPTDPTGYISIPPELIRGVSWKVPARCATTANITLSGAQTIDGVAAVAGDRVLVKAQTTGSQNGLWVCQTGAWIRAFDMDQDHTTAVPAEEVLGAVVLVLEGTVNGGTLWRVTNTATPILGTTAITWAQVGSGSSLTVKDEGSALATPASTIDFVGPGVTATGTGADKTITISGGATAADPFLWRPLMDGYGNVVVDSGTGEAIMAFGPA